MATTPPASLHHGDPTAVGVGDVVETKKPPWTPTNQRASGFIDHGLDLDVVCRERRGNKKEESVAALLALEMSGGPRNEFGQRDGPWFTGVRENNLWSGDSSSGYHTQEEGGSGASSLARMFSLGRQPIVSSVRYSLGSITIPGCKTAKQEPNKT